MPHITGIGTWFAPGSAAAANNASDDIDSTLAPGSNYYNAANTGAAGDAIDTGAANLANVGADFTPMDSDSSALAALSTNYLNNYMSGGGALTDAATAQAGADLARTGTPDLRQASQQEAGNVGATQANEQALNAQGAITNKAQATALQLKKAAMQMMISHTNAMTAIERQKLQQGVKNVGVSAAQSLQSGANQARQNQMSVYEGGRMTAANTAMQIGTGIIGAAGQIGGTVRQYMNSPGTASNVGNASAPIAPVVYSGGTGGTAGYAMPAPRTGSSLLSTANSKMALNSNVSNYNQYSSSPSNTSYPLASAWGMTSLNSTLPT